MKECDIWSVTYGINNLTVILWKSTSYSHKTNPITIPSIWQLTDTHKKVMQMPKNANTHNSKYVAMKNYLEVEDKPNVYIYNRLKVINIFSITIM